MTEFKKVEITLKVALLPANTKHPMEAVKRQLNSILFKYNEEVEGIPLSFSELKFPKGKEYGRIIAEQCWLHVDVATKLLVFKPEIGMLLVGKINKISDSHVSMLIYGMFNASISGEQMSSIFAYNGESKSWESDSRIISDGDSFEFKVANFQHAHGVLNIDGCIP